MTAPVPEISRRHSLKRAMAGALLATSVVVLSGEALAQETLRVGVWALPQGRGNPYTARAVPSVLTWTALFDKLTVINKQGSVDPMLADSWTTSDPTTWRFKLHDGVKFSNGEAFDAKAAKATFDWLMSEEGKATSVGKAIPTVASVEAEGNTLIIKTTRPDPILAKSLSVVMYVAPKAWADLGVEGFTAAPVGTGAYKVESLGPEKIVASANPNSWKKRANISTIEFIGLPESPSRNQALLSGQIDIDTDASVDNFAQLKAAGFKTDVVPASNTHGFSFLQTKEGSPFQDRRMRQAANYAVNKDEIIAGIYGGLGAPASQNAPPISFGYNKNLRPYAYDPGKAKQLMTEAGYANGVDLVIEGVNVSPALTNAMQAVADDLNAVGIRTTVRIIPVGQFIQNFISGKWPDDVGAIGVGSDHTGHLDAGVAFSTFHSCLKKPPFYCNEAEMPLVNAAATEFDADKRRKTLEDLMAMNRENAPLIFMAEQTNNMAYAPKVGNFENKVFTLNYHEMTLN
jgi:peptide/nickel transport system substrate-binding protein